MAWLSLTIYNHVIFPIWLSKCKLLTGYNHAWYSDSALEPTTISCFLLFQDTRLSLLYKNQRWAFYLWGRLLSLHQITPQLECVLFFFIENKPFLELLWCIVNNASHCSGELRNWLTTYTVNEISRFWTANNKVIPSMTRWCWWLEK